MPRQTGLILAWDKRIYVGNDHLLFELLVPYIDALKLGLEAIYAIDEEKTVADWMIENAQHCQMPVMWDAKLHDIGNTVERAIDSITNDRSAISMLTFHASMSDQALDRAASACSTHGIKALAVTMLTDIDEKQCRARFAIKNGGGHYVGDFVSEIVLNLAQVAYNRGFRGFVCSPKEVTLLRHEFGEEVTLVVPGVRPEWAPANDQKRVMTPTEAAEAGADYIVVGRPILEPPQHMTPVEAAKRIRAELEPKPKVGQKMDVSV